MLEGKKNRRMDRRIAKAFLVSLKYVGEVLMVRRGSWAAEIGGSTPPTYTNIQG